MYLNSAELISPSPLISLSLIISSNPSSHAKKSFGSTGSSGLSGPPPPSRPSHVAMIETSEKSSVEVLKVKGVKRSIGNYTVGTLHIAKMSKDFVSNIRELYQVNDLIQATVIKAKPAIELTTSNADDGVVYAKCDVTHEDLKIVDGKLWSEELRKVVNRKISKQYGKLQV